jgi:Rrf2 family transcriptional regulator, iron-sulfur cluster assembly transcription factor
MKLTTLSRYGVRALFDIAYCGEGKLVRASQVSVRQQISLNYIGQIFLKLKRAGLIISHRGRSGGYTLAYPPEKITLLMIIQAVEGPIILVDCLEGVEGCEMEVKCVTQDVWKGAGEMLENFFGKITIQDLIEKAKKRGISFEVS